MMKRTAKNIRYRPKVDVGGILNLFGSKMFTKNLLELKKTQKFHPAALRLKSLMGASRIQ